jgi:hypothetical protein
MSNKEKQLAQENAFLKKQIKALQKTIIELQKFIGGR